jgi:hypothetical protein
MAEFKHRGRVITAEDILYIRELVAAQRELSAELRKPVFLRK